AARADPQHARRRPASRLRHRVEDRATRRRRVPARGRGALPGAPPHAGPAVAAVGVGARRERQARALLPTHEQGLAAARPRDRELDPLRRRGLEDPAARTRMMDDEPGPAEPRRSARQINDDVDEELRFHLEMRAAELEAAGLDPAAARDEAARRFGDVAETQRACAASDRERERTLRRREYVAELVQDLAHGLRQLRARPLFALATIVTLALGIGATTAIFGAADHVLFRPLPYRAIDRVVALWELDRSGSAGKRPVSPGNFVDWADRTTSFEAIGLAEPSGSDLTGDGPPEPVASWRVTRGFFDALGVTPLLGRTFLPGEFEAGAAQAVLISHGLWQRRYAGDPAIVGRTIEVDGGKATVVGVLPRDLEYPGRKDLWAPKRFRPDELSDRRSSYMYTVARLRPGVSLAQARADLARVAAQLAQEFPRTNALLGV